MRQPRQQETNPRPTSEFGCCGGMQGSRCGSRTRSPRSTGLLESHGLRAGWSCDLTRSPMFRLVAVCRARRVWVRHPDRRRLFARAEGSEEVTVEPDRLRWLPAPHLLDHETHLAPESAGTALCGAGVMYADPGHPTTQRPRCPECRRIANNEQCLDHAGHQAQASQGKPATIIHKGQK